MTIHKSITLKRITQAVNRQMRTLDNPGFCIACGKSASDCEPDAEKYECKKCHALAVYGAEQLLFYVVA